MPEERAEYKTSSDDKTRVLLLAIRQALLIALGAIEEFLGIERSVVPKNKRL
jgi:hypothetical protein